MTTLIVGCGYLGQAVAHQLLARGEKVIGTVRSSAKADRLATQGISPHQANVLEPETLANLPEAERIVYCVGFDRSAGVSMRSVYVNGLRSFLEQQRGRFKKFVYASSTGVYGQADGGWVTEDSPTEPTHESGRVCLKAERLLLADDKDQSASFVILRFAGLYGPGRIVRRDALVQNKPIVGDPAKYLNLVHRDDAARAVVAALENPKASGIYLVCDDRPVTRREYYERAAELLGAPAPRFEAPAPGSLEASREASNKRISNRRMHEELGVALEYPEIATGLAAAFSEDG